MDRAGAGANERADTQEWTPHGWLPSQAPGVRNGRSKADIWHQCALTPTTGEKTKTWHPKTKTITFPIPTSEPESPDAPPAAAMSETCSCCTAHPGTHTSWNRWKTAEQEAEKLNTHWNKFFNLKKKFESKISKWEREKGRKGRASTSIC